MSSNSSDNKAMSTTEAIARSYTGASDEDFQAGITDANTVAKPALNAITPSGNASLTTTTSSAASSTN
ncbi:MAG: hypothetical protein LBR56_01490, partial [Sporomusaceae bacterium]|nr:hypothetical protein [Sporomusaceae bacterium]